MTVRRIQVLDAAIAILGRHGVRGVTHRAVDAEAGVPLGTTSNHFRTRDALFEGVVDRFAERERAAFEALGGPQPPTTFHELARQLSAVVVSATGERREVTLARFALLVEAAIHPPLQRKLREGAAAVNAWAEPLIRAAGSKHPQRDLALLANHVDAVTLHQLAYPEPDFDPEPGLLALVTLLMRD